MRGVIHDANPSIVSFLPPPEELPEFTLDSSLFEAKLNLATFLFEKFHQYGILDNIAFDCESHQLSFGELIDRSKSIANALHSRGIQVGDRVLVLVDLPSFWLEVIFGIVLNGAIAVQDLPHTKEKVLHHLKNSLPKYVFVDSTTLSVPHVLENSNATVVVVNQKSSQISYNDERVIYLEDLLQFPPNFENVATKGASAALMFHTSGSTGAPKGCLSTHASWVEGSHQAKLDGNPYSGIQKGDKLYPILAANSYFFCCVMYGFSQGATLIVSKSREPQTILTTLAKGVSWTASTPPIHNKLLRYIKDNPTQWEEVAGSLKGCICAGEHHSSHFASDWKSLSGVDLINLYGSTEANCSIGTSPSSPMPGSLGRAYPNVQVEILDSNFSPLPNCSPGLLAYKSYGGCIYWNNLEKQSYYVHKGWNIPRDICTRDENGYIWFVGREDDLIITKSGGNVSVIEIEGILLTDSRVHEVAVVGRKTDEDREDGKLTLIKAFVATTIHKDDHSVLAKELQQLITIRSEFPLDEVEFIESIPKLHNGKLNRRALH